jgi:hypothetical protein
VGREASGDDKPHRVNVPAFGPRLFVGGLSKRVFLATRWHTEGEMVVADEKVDITDQFVAVALELDEDWWNTKTQEAQGV